MDFYSSYKSLFPEVGDFQALIQPDKALSIVQILLVRGPRALGRNCSYHLTATHVSNPGPALQVLPHRILKST